MFNIGQKVVCIEVHPEGYLEMGKIYSIEGLHEKCGCGMLVDVGIKTKSTTSFIHCMSCGKIRQNDGIKLFSPRRFAPVEEISNTTFDEIMEQFLILKSDKF